MWQVDFEFLSSQQFCIGIHMDIADYIDDETSEEFEAFKFTLGFGLFSINIYYR